MRYELVESLYSSLDYTDIGDKQFVVVKGWNHEENVKEFILNEVEEHYGKDLTLTIQSKKETGYTSSRFYEGQDAKDEGYKRWVETREYKKGLGKCTVYGCVFSEVKL